MTRLIAITGGTGFLGRYIVRALIARGHRVRLLCRSRPVHPQLADLTFEAVAGDLDSPTALAALMTGADTLVHAAGLVAAPSRAAFQAVNVAGTAAAAETARRAGARFILVSSLAAREPQLSDYARSKAGSEAVARDRLGPSGDWAVLRPCAVYGPWDMMGLSIFQLMGRRLSVLPGRPRARVALIHAADAAQAVAKLADLPAIRGTFEATDARTSGYGWRELSAFVASALGTRPYPLFLPPAALRLAARLPLSGSMLSPGKAREILHEDWASSPQAQLPPEVWRPVIALPQGLAETLDWYRSQGLLRSAG